MGKLISLLIDRSQQRLMGFLLWLGAFSVSLALVVTFVAGRLNSELSDHASALLRPVTELRVNVENASLALAETVTAEPCSPAFHEQLRRVAFLPDGLSEFLYIRDGVVQCSVGQNFEPFALGKPSMVMSDRTVYLQPDLGPLSLTGLVGSVTVLGDFGIVSARFPEVPPVFNQWVTQEVVVAGTTGPQRVGGVTGNLAAYETALDLGAFRLGDGNLYSMICEQKGTVCVILRGSLGTLLGQRWSSGLIGLVIVVLVSLAISGQLHAWIRRIWSFESRFRRNFKPENIICTYQPILSIETGQISGCEVLVRWRDVDDSVIFPDQFLPIIARHGLTRDLTRMVVRRAFDELSAKVPPHLRLQINFNITPADLDAVWLRETLAVFDEAGERFRIVVEIVESDEVEIEHAAREIEALRRFGIRTQLDDFGTGYSNIQNLATLPLDGVKLDRSFAMADDGALMHRMMFSTIEMIHAAGHRLTVEGVESEERLRQLAATGHVQFAQGYHIARPLDIDRLVQLIGERSAASRPRLVA